MPAGRSPWPSQPTALAHAFAFRCPWPHQARIIAILRRVAIEPPTTLADRAMRP
jgi:hypothetical protein